MSTQAGASAATTATYRSCERVTPVTARGARRSHLSVIEAAFANLREMETKMTKLYCILAAVIVFAPVALAAVSQAARIGI